MHVDGIDFAQPLRACDVCLSSVLCVNHQADNYSREY